MIPASHYQLGYLKDSDDAAHFVDTDVECPIYIHAGKIKMPFSLLHTTSKFSYTKMITPSIFQYHF